ncbi:MAG: long-chain fatty acid--CoA ligase [Actinobacteria bacterium]|nr:long-chain fatty acid--CoA ligase [Actinomycetota bacterium]
MLTLWQEPRRIAMPAWNTLLDALDIQVTQRPDARVASILHEGKFSEHRNVQERYDDILSAARGLIAAGVRPGDRVAVMSRSRYEWTVLDCAIWHCGATTVPIYETSSADQVQWILNDSGSIAVFVETEAHMALVNSVRENTPALAHVWCIDDAGLQHLADAGAHVGNEALSIARSTLTPDSIATVIYTSGTTGRPRGCSLTHGNLVFEVSSLLEAIPDAIQPTSVTVLFLPLAHVLARVLQAAFLAQGAQIGYVTDVKDLMSAMSELHPSIIVAVPRVFERIINTATHNAETSGKSAIFAKALDAARDYSLAMDKGRIPLSLRAKRVIFDRLVYSKMRAVLGGDLRWVISGGAPLGARLGHIFRGIGTTICEGYGLTETSAGTSLNRGSAKDGRRDFRIGSVGRPVPGTGIRVADDGELQIIGGHVFAGYWRNEEATHACFTDDGWFRTGDLGTIDDDGFVYITGRAKEIIVTAGGKNVAPAVLEDPINASFLVASCMVVGEGQPFIGALVTIDRDSLALWLRRMKRPEGFSISELANDEQLRAEIQHTIDQANRRVSQAEQIRKFAIVDAQWSVMGGQLTPSMKLKRSVVLQQHAGDVAALYAR